MFRIKDFARFTRVSAKMLRHYDALGLLKPARVDPHTGYRYYAADQVPRLNRLLALRDLGFSLEQIAGLLEAALSAEEMRGLLKARRAEIEAQLRGEQARLARVEARLRSLDEQSHWPPFEVVVRAVPAQRVAALRQRVSAADDAAIARLFEAVETYLAGHRARDAHSPLMLYHATAETDDHLEVEVAVPATRPLPAAGPLHVYELPGAPEMACVVYAGSYAVGEGALEALTTWVEANGYLVTGPLREVYLRFSATAPERWRLPPAFLTDDEQQFVTELQFPVTRRSTAGGPTGGDQ